MYDFVLGNNIINICFTFPKHAADNFWKDCLDLECSQVIIYKQNKNQNLTVQIKKSTSVVIERGSAFWFLYVFIFQGSYIEWIFPLS